MVLPLSIWLFSPINIIQKSHTTFVIHCTYIQALLKAFCACKHRSKKNVPEEKIECNRWSYTDLDGKCLQKFEPWHFIPAGGAHRSRRLMSAAPIAKKDIGSPNSGYQWYSNYTAFYLLKRNKSRDKWKYKICVSRYARRSYGSRTVNSIMS